MLGSGCLTPEPLLCPVQPAQTFVVRRGVHVSGASPESISSLLSEVAECGTHYARLSRFSLQPVLDSSCSKGLVFQVRPSASRRSQTYPTASEFFPRTLSASLFP